MIDPGQTRGAQQNNNDRFVAGWEASSNDLTSKLHLGYKSALRSEETEPVANPFAPRVPHDPKRDVLPVGINDLFRLSNKDRPVSYVGCKKLLADGTGSPVARVFVRGIGVNLRKVLTRGIF